MWAYPRSSCPDRPSPEELSVGEVEAQIRKVLDSAVIPSPGVARVRVSTLGPVSALVILCRALGMVVMSRATLVHPRMPQGGRRDMPSMGPRG
jgi:hypothetical protein